MSPQEYDERLWSLEFDPPAEDLLRTLTNLLAQLIADQRNIHGGKDAAVAHAADFLPAEPKDEEEERDEDSQIAEEAQEVNAIHRVLVQAGTQPGQGIVSRGARPPAEAMAAFFGKTEEPSP